MVFETGVDCLIAQSSTEWKLGYSYAMEQANTILACVP